MVSCTALFDGVGSLERCREERRWYLLGLIVDREMEGDLAGLCLVTGASFQLYVISFCLSSTLDIGEYNGNSKGFVEATEPGI